MPAIPGFSDNAFRTRSDLLRAALTLLKPIEQYKSSSGARIKVATGTGAGFSETAAQLEGFSRPLWVVAHLLRFRSPDPAVALLEETNINVNTWINGLKVGTDPNSQEYWGDVFGFDQRMVEMESIAYTLLLNPDTLSFADDPKTRSNLVKWLRSINDHNMPQNNWLWFRVFVNLALVYTLKVPLEQVKGHIDRALKTLDSFYIGEGWSSDGLWGDERKQVDYYSGSFAIQFAQLLFVRIAPDYDIERTERYKKGAGEFSRAFWRYFHKDGAAIPFGRSLTYRFAFAAFWSAAAAAEVKLPPPFSDPGAVKGMLLRHLRWWAKQPHIFNTDGTLNIGFCYPNMYPSEDYNSPQSAFWCLKSFLVLGLSEDHAFWTSEEAPHPFAEIELQPDLLHVEAVRPPRHILCNTPEHHFLLSSGQSTGKRFKAREAKYAKFAYSSAFGFSVPVGPFLEQQAPDSTLAACFTDEENWKVRWSPSDAEWDTFKAGEEIVPTMTSLWKPWVYSDLRISTRLIPSMKTWSGWHVRIHKIMYNASKPPRSDIILVDSGFAASAQDSDGLSIYERAVHGAFPKETDAVIEGWWCSTDSALIVSESGASGIADLTSKFIESDSGRLNGKSRIIKADPNTNLIRQRTLIPSLEFTVDISSGNQSSKQAEVDEVAWFVTGVFAIDNTNGRCLEDVWALWHNQPSGI